MNDKRSYLGVINLDQQTNTIQAKEIETHAKSQKVRMKKAVGVAQLAERSLPTPEVHNSNPVIGKIYIDQFNVN